MAKAEYFCVRCKYCHNPIPLAEFDPNLHFRWTAPFSLRHADQIPTSECIASGDYDSSDLIDKTEMEKIAGFSPHPAVVSNLSR